MQTEAQMLGQVKVVVQKHRARLTETHGEFKANLVIEYAGGLATLMSAANMLGPLGRIIQQPLEKAGVQTLRLAIFAWTGIEDDKSEEWLKAGDVISEAAFALTEELEGLAEEDKTSNILVPPGVH